MERLTVKLDGLFAEDLDDWVVIPPDEKQAAPAVTWAPVNIKKHAAKSLWQHADQFLLMSGTILSHARLAGDLGLDPNEVKFISVDFSFPPQNRPIYFLPTADMTSSSLEAKGEEAVWGQVSQKADEIISAHPHVKGLVHTANYRLAQYFMEHSRHRGRSVTHQNAAAREECINSYKASEQPLVIVSPSLERGFDGSDDLCRFIIVLKIPYPNPYDPQIDCRLHQTDGQVWYILRVIRAIIQETSRGNRHNNDYCESYILDKRFSNIFYGEQDKWGYWHSGYQAFFPRYWKEALHNCEKAPGQCENNVP